jgi:hypothetical protein
VLSFQLKCITFCSLMINGSPRAVKVGVATMCQGSHGHELGTDHNDRDPDHCRQLPFRDHGTSLAPELWLNLRAPGSS